MNTILKNKNPATFSELLEIVNFYNGIKFNKPNINEDIISTIFYIGYIKNPDYNPDAYYFNFDKDYNLTIFDVNYSDENWGNHIVINEENKSKIEDIIKSFPIYIYNIEEYTNEIIKKFNKIINPVNFFKYLDFNKNSKTYNSSLERNQLCFEDFIFKNEISTLEQLKEKEHLLEIKNINFNLQTFFLNIFLSEIETNIKIKQKDLLGLIETQREDFFNDEENELIENNTEEDSETKIKVYQIDKDSREIIREVDYSLYDFITLPFADILLEEFICVDEILESFNSKKTTLLNENQNILYFPLYNISDYTYGLIRMTINDNISYYVYKQSKYDKSTINIINEEKALLINNENLLNILKIALNDFLSTKIQGNPFNIKSYDKCSIGEFLT